MNESTKTVVIKATDNEWFAIRAALRERIESNHEALVSLAILGMTDDAKDKAKEIRFLTETIEKTYH